MDSWITQGIPSLAASRITGPLTYPPVPTHTSGANSRRIFFASALAVNMRTTVWALRARFFGVSFRWKPEMVTVRIS